MRTPFLIFYLGINLFLSDCNILQKKDNTDKEAIYKNCIKTFNDSEKCKQLLQETEKTTQETPTIKLTPEEDSKIKIRSDVKDNLQGRNHLFVLEYLGEPDEKYRDGSGREHYIYTRPVCRYSVNHDPDKELRVILLRGSVVQIYHTSPDTTPASDLNLFKKSK